MRRRIAIITAFLILGAIVNVAVAWGIALLVNPVAESEWSTARRYEVGVSAWSINRYSKRGVRWFTSRYDELSEVRAYWTPDEDVEAILPRWGALARPTAPFQYREVIGYGWPFTALWAELASTTMESDAAIRGAIQWHNTNWAGTDPGEWAWQGHIIRVPAVLPCLPAWPGFIINTLIYAALLWLIFIAPFAARRMIRRKRGLCEKCAYPIGVSPVCTECGAAIVPMRAN